MATPVKLSIVIICWNDRDVLTDCIESVYRETRDVDFEIILADNASTDGSAELVERTFPDVRIVRNSENLGFAAGNNAGIALARGEYILILNPDTIVHDRAVDRLVAYAEAHPEGGAFGCRILNPDGSFQVCARPFPTLARQAACALYLRYLQRVFPWFPSDAYHGWNGESEREIDWQMGCCVLVRATAIAQVGAFDERFSYHYEEVDLCYRIRTAGWKILYFPDARVTHLGAEARGRRITRLRLETYRNRYRFFAKHYGTKSLRPLRTICLVGLAIRLLAYRLLAFRNPEAVKPFVQVYGVLLKWNWRLRVSEFAASGAEPDVGYPSAFPSPPSLDRKAAGPLRR